MAKPDTADGFEELRERVTAALADLKARLIEAGVPPKMASLAMLAAVTKVTTPDVEPALRVRWFRALADVTEKDAAAEMVGLLLGPIGHG